MNLTPWVIAISILVWLVAGSATTWLALSKTGRGEIDDTVDVFVTSGWSRWSAVCFIYAMSSVLWPLTVMTLLTSRRSSDGDRPSDDTVGP